DGSKTARKSSSRRASRASPSTASWQQRRNRKWPASDRRGPSVGRSSARLRVARRGGAGQHGVDPTAFLIESGEQRAVEYPAARQLDLHRIDEAPVDENLVMQVCPGRQSRRADIADHLPLADLLTGLQVTGESRHVAIGGLVAVGVPDAD